MAELVPNVDIGEVERDSGFLGFLRSLPEKPATTFRFFDRNDYYTVHSSDAEYVCREVFRTMSVLKYLGSGDKKIGSVCLSKRNFEALLVDLLLVKRYRVEVYQNTGAKGNAWSLVTRASPGNLAQVEDVLFGGNTQMSEAKGVMAVSVKFDGKQQTVGIAYGDAVLQELTVVEFDDDEHFSNLCTVLVHLGPQECLISSPDAKKFAEVKGIVERSGILLTECKPADFVSKDIVQDLGRLLAPSSVPQGQAAMLPEVDLKVAMESLAGVIKYLNLTSDSENFGRFRMSTFDFSQYMRINSAAIRALGVLPGSDDQKADLSLLKVLNRCRTPGGQRLLAQWLKQPLTDVRKIEERLEMVELFVQKGELRHCLHEDYLRHFPDLLRVAKRLQRHKSTLQELYKTYQTLKVLPKVREVLSKAADEDKRAVLQGLFVKPLAELENDFSKYLEMVETTLDLEAAESGDFLVKPDFDDDLQALREELDSLEAKCQGYLDKAARDLGLEASKTIKLESNKELGFHFRITRKEERALRSRKGYVVIDTKQNGVRFRSPDLLSSNASYLDTRRAYEEAQQSIAKMIVDIAGGYAEPMHQLSDVISHLDVLVGLAVAAASASKPYVRPKILEKGSGILKMTGLRHACVESQDNIMFIPNDIEMKKGSSSCYIITGPNMGGKSTYIRSVALAVLMAQVGSFVPCDSAELSLVDAVLTRIGAGDQQLKGVSTFMAEMLESAHILRNATADSLVVIDELGRGTSTYDGFGLAWAISEHLSKEADAYCLFATHFHELTELAQELPCVRNVHVTADVREDSFTLLYKVKPGVCNKSFGVEVAELTHFPEHVIKDARQVLAQLEGTARLEDSLPMDTQ
ncbi:DNA mismatch repair protein Msh2 [Ixodes scapularis]|nr:DNA mismatch repair protein Msh2 [Ixodes scapularis]